MLYAPKPVCIIVCGLHISSCMALLNNFLPSPYLPPFICKISHLLRSVILLIIPPAALATGFQSCGIITILPSAGACASIIFALLVTLLYDALLVVIPICFIILCSTNSSQVMPATFAITSPATMYKLLS